MPPPRPSFAGAGAGSWPSPRPAGYSAFPAWPPTRPPSTVSSASSAAWPPSSASTASPPTPSPPVPPPGPCSRPAPRSTTSTARRCSPCTTRSAAWSSPTRSPPSSPGCAATTPAASPPHVAVVIPVRNDAGGLAATLATLGSGPAVVVVVDDGSLEPGLVAGVCSPHGATLVRRAVPGGPGAARNCGWRATAGELVAFVDANCEPDPGWLDRVLRHFADPQVAAVAPRIAAVADAAAPGWLANYEAVSSPLDVGRREASVRPRSSVAYVPTAALVVRRSALEAVGGFDEALSVCEDVDFVWRLVAGGWTVRYEPRAAVRHPMRPTATAWLAQRYRYGTSAAALAARHGAAVAPAVVAPWTAAAWALLAAGHPLAGAAAAAYSVAALAGLGPSPSTLRQSGPPADAEAVRRTGPPACPLPVGLPTGEALR